MKRFQTLWNYLSVALLITLSVILLGSRQAEAALRQEVEAARKSTRSVTTAFPPSPKTEVPVASTTAAPSSPNSSPAPAKPTEAKPTETPPLPEWSTGNPTLDALAVRRLGWTLRARNEGLFADLHLPEEKKSKLREVLLQKAHDERNQEDIAFRQKLSAQEKAATKRTLAEQYEKTIESALGPENYAQYKRDLAEHTFKAHMVQQGDWAGCFLEAGAPLSPQQAGAFYALLHQSAAPLPSAVTPPSREQAQGDFVARASQFLRPEQVAAVKTYFEVDRRISEELNRPRN